jgi:hypothetical protein
MIKKIFIILILLFFTLFIFPDSTDDFYNPKNLEEATEIIESLANNLELVLNEYDKLEKDYNSIVEINKKYKTQIELLINRIEESNLVLEKLKKEKNIQTLSNIINIGFVFEADCKSTQEKFLFDTWYAGIHILLYKRVFLQTSVGYTFNFNIKMGVGFYLW